MEMMLVLTGLLHQFVMIFKVMLAKGFATVFVLGFLSCFSKEFVKIRSHFSEYF